MGKLIQLFRQIDPPDPDEFELEGLCPWCMEWQEDCHCDEPVEE